MGGNESGAVKSPLKHSQPPCWQASALHFRLNQERRMPGRVKSPDSARPPLDAQNARRSNLDRASCTRFASWPTNRERCRRQQNRHKLSWAYSYPPFPCGRGVAPFRGRLLRISASFLRKRPLPSFSPPCHYGPSTVLLRYCHGIATVLLRYCYGADGASRTTTCRPALRRGYALCFTSSNHHGPRFRLFYDWSDARSLGSPQEHSGDGGAPPQPTSGFACHLNALQQS
jgi:hypothetical protein